MTAARLSLFAALGALLASSPALADQAPVPDEADSKIPTAGAVDGEPMAPADALSTRFTAGAFIGAAAPSRSFGVTSEDASLDQGFLVGVRGGVRIARRFELEVEGTLGSSSVRDADESATILAGRASLRGVLNPDADATLFALVGLGAIASLNAEPLIDETTRATGHYGIGVAMRVNEMAAVRLEARHIVGRGSDDGVSSMGELHIGGGFEF